MTTSGCNNWCSNQNHFKRHIRSASVFTRADEQVKRSQKDSTKLDGVESRPNQLRPARGSIFTGRRQACEHEYTTWNNKQRFYTFEYLVQSRTVHGTVIVRTHATFFQTHPEHSNKDYHPKITVLTQRVSLCYFLTHTHTHTPNILSVYKHWFLIFSRIYTLEYLIPNLVAHWSSICSYNKTFEHQIFNRHTDVFSICCYVTLCISIYTHLHISCKSAHALCTLPVTE